MLRSIGRRIPFVLSGLVAAAAIAYTPSTALAQTRCFFCVQDGSAIVCAEVECPKQT